MKVAIISDIHDNQINLQKVLDWCGSNSITSIFCCGDVTNLETLEMIVNNFSGDIYLVRGNCELYDEKDIVPKGHDKILSIKYCGKIANFKLDKYSIGLCHEPYLINKVLDKKCDIIFYGHTHKPWIEDRGDTKIVNPGTLGGTFSLGTFAVWDTENGNLKLLRVENL
jgi:uncharacterized protein